MSELKKSVERCGFDDVSTYIQSGNVLFESEQESLSSISERLQRCLSEDFPEIDTKVLVKTAEQMKRIVSDAPREWATREELRCYIALVPEPYSPKDLTSNMEPKAGVDFLEEGEGVVYMSTLLSGLTKSGLSKVILRKIYKAITIRNFNTVRKIVALLEQQSG